jgi:hypothetical protein
MTSDRQSPYVQVVKRFDATVTNSPADRVQCLHCRCGVSREHSFGPHDGPKIVNFVYKNYSNVLSGMFPSAENAFCPQAPGPREEQ